MCHKMAQAITRFYMVSQSFTRYHTISYDMKILHKNDQVRFGIVCEQKRVKD